MKPVTKVDHLYVAHYDVRLIVTAGTKVQRPNGAGWAVTMMWWGSQWCLIQPSVAATGTAYNKSCVE